MPTVIFTVLTMDLTASMGSLAGSADSAGMSSARLDANLGSLLSGWAADGRMPSAECLVARRGKVLFI